VTDTTTELRRISHGALRLARLAHMNAPSAILLDVADVLARRVEQMHRAAGGDPEEFRREMAAAEFFTPDEQAEMEAEDQRYAQADEAARKANGYSEEMWGRLDDIYRFDLVMHHYPEVP
jgi:hypothetical protein